MGIYYIRAIGTAKNGGAPLRRLGPRDARRINQPPTSCAACQNEFVAGDFTALFALGPGIYKEERERARNNRVYNAVAVEVHWSCATGEE